MASKYCSRNLSLSGIRRVARKLVLGSEKGIQDCLQLDPINSLVLSPEKPVCGSTSPLDGRAISNSTSGRRYSEQPNSLIFNGYSMYPLTKSKPNGEQFHRFRLKGLHRSSFSACSSSIAHNVSVDNNTRQMEQKSNCENSPQLRLNSASCYLPHPDKEETGGEDAHFICTGKHTIGLADGVGGWAELGIDAGKFSRELMSNSANAIKEEPQGNVDPARVLEKAYNNTKAEGSSTACIITLTNKGLHAINLGDSGFMVVREGCTVFRSPVQLHDFNFTYQLVSGRTGDLPGSGQVFTVSVASGDVIIAGTDGLFDNLYNTEITALVVQAVRAGFGPQVTAENIASLARQRAQDKNRQTPFSTAAQEAGYRFYGGKPDDITVIVSYITGNQNESPSTNNACKKSDA